MKSKHVNQLLDMAARHAGKARELHHKAEWHTRMGWGLIVKTIIPAKEDKAHDKNTQNH